MCKKHFGKQKPKKQSIDRFIELGWKKRLIDRLIELGFNATSTADVISWLAVTHMYFLAFTNQHNFLSKAANFLSVSTCENTPEKKSTSTGYQTHNRQVIGQTRLPLGHTGGLCGEKKKNNKENVLIFSVLFEENSTTLCHITFFIVLKKSLQ